MAPAFLFEARDRVVLVAFALTLSLVFNWRVWLSGLNLCPVAWPALKGDRWSRLANLLLENGLAVILLMAAALRLVGIAHDQLWYDEGFTAAVARLPVGQLLAATAADVHPPLLYLIEKPFVMLFGINEWALRLPAALLGTVAIWLAFQVVRELAGEHAGLLAAGLLAVSPFAIYYSNEARMYSLLLAAVLLATLGALRQRAWLVVVGLTAALMSHNLGALYVPVVGALVWQRSGLRRALLVCGTATLVWATLWGPVVLAQMGEMQQAGYWIEQSQASAVGRWLHEVKSLLFGPDVLSWIIPVDSLIAFALLLLPVMEAVRRRSVAGLTLAWLAFAPAIEMLIIALAWKPMTLARPLIGGLYAWLGLVAWWALLPRRWDLFRATAVGVAASAFLLVTTQYYVYNRAPYAQPIAGWLQDHAQPGDVIMYVNPSAYIALGPYLQNQTVCLSSDTSPLYKILTRPCEAEAWQRAWLVLVNSDYAPIPWSVERAEALVKQYHGQEMFRFENSTAYAVVWELNQPPTLTLSLWERAGVRDAG